MRNQYKNLENSEYVVCLLRPFDKDETKFTEKKRYKITLKKDVWVWIIDDRDSDVRFNIHSPFGDCFCTETYLRKKKLENIKNV